MSFKKTSLIILDWFWINDFNLTENAIHLADTPNFDKLFWEDIFSSLEASWEHVWVLKWQIWNSEVWHMTIWSWRIVKQTILEINDLFTNWSFSDINSFKDWINHSIKNNSKLHIIWLIWPWWVHAYWEHLFNIIKLIPSNINVFLHIFWDWRDTNYKSLAWNIESLNDFLQDYNNVKIASICWRFYSMDRDNNWDRIEMAYNSIVLWNNLIKLSPLDYVNRMYEQNIYDEFIVPAVFVENWYIQDNDAVFFINFRSDRARQLTQAIINDNLPSSFMSKKLDNIYFVSMTKYYENYSSNVFVEKKSIKNTLPELFSNLWLKQLHLAETEKFAHVTKFFSGWNNIAYENQDNILIPSPKVKTYDLRPEMSAFEVFDYYKNNFLNYDFTVVNFANWDMVWHSWSIDASIKAVEALDKIVWELIELSKINSTHLIITADHWNCEQMWTIDNPHTAHTLNKVPCFYISSWKQIELKNSWWLKDIAPTILDIMWIKVPQDMTWESLIAR